MKKFTALILSLAALITPANAVTILWDFTYDTDNFFTEERRQVLDLVSGQFSHLWIDSPDLENPPQDGAYWNWTFYHPNTNELVSLPGELAAGTLTIFLGSRDLGGSTLARGGPTGSQARGTQSWLNVYNSLNTPEAFKPFAGAITMSSEYTWYSGLDAVIPSNQVDLFSVMVHEVGHVLGIGTGRKAWEANTLDGYFIGENAVALYGEPIPLSINQDHTGGVMYDGLPLLMNTSISHGTRLHWSDLETAMLLDMGYVLIPEVETYLLFGVGVIALLVYRRRRVAA